MMANHPPWERLSSWLCIWGCEKRWGPNRHAGVAPLGWQARMKAHEQGGGCVEWRGTNRDILHLVFFISPWEWEGRKETSGSLRMLKFLRSHWGLGDQKKNWERKTEKDLRSKSIFWLWCAQVLYASDESVDSASETSIAVRCTVSEFEKEKKKHILHIHSSRESPAPGFPMHCRILFMKASEFAATKKKSQAEKLDVCRHEISKYIDRCQHCGRSWVCHGASCSEH